MSHEAVEAAARVPCLAFVRIAELGIALGVGSIRELPECWQQQVGEHWWFAMNGHDVAMPASSPTGASSDAPFMVEPFHAYVEFTGWPAGVLNPYDGVLAAGSAANEDEFIAALEAEKARIDSTTPGSAG